MEEPVAAERVEGRSREHWMVLALSTLALVGLGAMRVLLTPSPQGYGTHEQLGLPVCSAIAWFGIPCPGCGVTRAVTWFAHGHPWNSLVTQPFGFALGAAALLALPYGLVRTACGGDLRNELRALGSRKVWIAGVAFVIAAWIYKIVVVRCS